MNSWSQNQTQNNLTVGQTQFNPYWGTQPNAYGRLPIYRADPIHGENAAWQFPMGANSEIYLPDADEDIIWWIRTDEHGNKNVMSFDVAPHKKPQPVDTNELAARLAAVEEWINGKQNKSNTKRAATTNATPAVESVN